MSYEQTEQAYLSGHYSKAAELAEELIRSEPQNPRLRLLRGHIFYSLGRIEQARVEYELIRGLTPDPDIVEQALLGMDRCDSVPQADTAADTEGTVIVPIGAELPSIDELAIPSLELPPTPVLEPATPALEADNPFAIAPDSEPVVEATVSADAPWLSDFNGSGAVPDDQANAESSAMPWAEAVAPDTDAPSTDQAAAVPWSEEGLAAEAEPAIDSTTPTPEPEAIAAASLDLGDEEIDDLASDFLALNGAEPLAVDPTDANPDRSPLEVSDHTAFEEMAEEMAGEVLDDGEPVLATIAQEVIAANPLPDLPEPPNLAMAAAIARQPVTSPLRPEETQSASRTVPATNSAPKTLPTAPQQQSLSQVGLVALISALAAGVVGVVGWQGAKEESRTPIVLTSLASIAIAGAASAFASTRIQQQSSRRYRELLDKLNDQCQRIGNGDFETPLQLAGRDDVGILALRFDRMRSTLGDRVNRQEKRLAALEQQREGLQNQVIRLLDDVEGVAHGDLTVQAEVTADVLGAVADSFNLTIQNLREIVEQVRDAALQVNVAASDNEQSAQNLSAEALRQAEKLAAALDSVQAMTQSIQRVAVSASEAETVARAASQTALKGGEAVDKTLSGILRIRETVAETTRKVKKLAESSQEISKIVALISQVASRTNLLALNASIEAARAGQAGRGFAIVADEVRQLADRAAKSSKEIEQIVLQIQSETGLVMTAMEEGTQQVIQGTRLAEQARGALDEIIQVSTKIDELVQSITADTVDQTAMSRSMAEIMQSVETTAQSTSQEAQKVATSLQGLVTIAGTLRESVDRFRLQASATKEK